MASGDSFRIFGSNALRTVLMACLPAFERAQGIAAEIEYGATNHTLQRMRSGATADLVIATSGAIDELMQEGRILPATRTDLAVAVVGACVLAGAPKPDISTVDKLKQALLNARSVAYSQAGQSGLHMAKMIEQLGIDAAVKAKAKINPAGLVGELVVRGEAELGFQQISELLAVPGVDIVGPLPDAVQLKSVFAAGIGAGSAKVVQAQALIRELQSPTAARLMREAGLTPC